MDQTTCEREQSNHRPAVRLAEVILRTWRWRLMQAFSLDRHFGVLGEMTLSAWKWNGNVSLAKVEGITAKNGGVCVCVDM